MIKPSPVFKETRDSYRRQIEMLDLAKRAAVLGGTMEADQLVLTLFRTPYFISPAGVLDVGGQKAPFDVTIILSQYVLMCPDAIPQKGGWAHYRELTNTSPLASYWCNHVERDLIEAFTGRTEILKASAQKLLAVPERAPAGDVDAVVEALPRVALRLVFNDADDEFPAGCTALLDRTVETFLDGESLAVLGAIFTSRLKEPL